MLNKKRPVTKISFPIPQMVKKGIMAKVWSKACPKDPRELPKSFVTRLECWFPPQKIYVYLCNM